MSRTVKLSRLESVLDDLDYPVVRRDAAEEFEDVTLLLADGEENLGDAVTALSSEEFESRDDLEAEIYQYLPVEALGEPGQSEGDA